MDCVRKYVIDCSSEEQRNKFNEAVSNSIDSVHAICSSERYRRGTYETNNCKIILSFDFHRVDFWSRQDYTYDFQFSVSVYSTFHVKSPVQMPSITLLETDRRRIQTL